MTWLGKPGSFMVMTQSAIRIVEPSDADTEMYRRRYAECIVMTKDDKILLMCLYFSATNSIDIMAFGGQVPCDKTPAEALASELGNDLSAEVNEDDLVHLCAFTLDQADQTELFHAFFW